MTAAACGPCSASRRALGQLLDPVRGLERRAQMREIGVAAGGVDDHEQAVRDAADDQIVEHAALLVGQHRVAQPALAEPRDVARHQRLERRAARIAMDQHLAHVGDVEQRGRAPAVPVLGHDAGRVLHGQRPAGEIDHPAAELEVQLVQRRAARRRHRCAGW